MKIKNIMSKSVEQIVADSTLFEAAALMTSLDVGLLPVFEGDQLVGVITDRDIVTRAVAEGLDPTQTLVRDAMTAEIFSCHPEDEDADAARIMEEHRVRRLLVIGDDEKVVGVCSLADIVRKTKDRNLTADIMQEVVQPTGSSHT